MEKNLSNIIHVLLIEDEPIVQKVHCKMLERLGCKVDLAVSGEEALSKVANPYQLIFMDLGLPDIDGYALTSEMRRRENGIKRAPIIVLTAYMLSEVSEGCLAVGADTVFNKPINIETLKNILERFV